MKQRSSDLLSRAGGHQNFRVVVTGSVGVEKKPYLQHLVEYAIGKGRSVRLFNVGDLMYADAPDVAPGRILDLPLGRLTALRRSAFKEILADINSAEVVIINTHASFRWKHGLFPAFDHDQMQRLDADLYITLVDNVDSVHERLCREHKTQHTLKDVIVWREEEILATEVLASAIRGHGSFYIAARGAEASTIPSLYKLIFQPTLRKVYPSFPMTHVAKLPDTLAAINEFRAVLAEHFVTFDPGDVDEKRLVQAAVEASSRGEETVTVNVNDRVHVYGVEDIFSVAKDIDAQIYARDFKLIDQSDIIVSYIPELPDGKPCLSSGVERELQHAHEVTKEVYVVWQPKTEPSPFITETANQVFRTLDEAIAFFESVGYIKSAQRSLHMPRAAHEEV